MNKVDTFNEMTIAKNMGKDGIACAINLLQDLREFSRKLGECISAQTDPEVRIRISAMVSPTERMYQDLSSVVATAKLVEINVAEDVEAVTPSVTKANKTVEMITTIGKLS